MWGRMASSAVLADILRSIAGLNVEPLWSKPGTSLAVNCLFAGIVCLAFFRDKCF